MKNKRNKKLLSSVLMALSLSSSVSFNNKIANANYKNANYKDDDKKNLSSLFDSINSFVKNSENKEEIINKLSTTVNGIYQNRQSNKENSILFKSMRDNGTESFLTNEENKKHYGPDLHKAYVYNLLQRKGGHFTVWDKTTKSHLNKLADKLSQTIYCCDAWFYALGGTQNDIDEYKKDKETFREVLNCQEINEDKIDSQDNVFSDLNLKNICAINKDTDRTWDKKKEIDSNVAEKEKILNNVLKVYACHKNGYFGYFQGYGIWCANIIDKFVGCKNKEISEETEAKIYYVYKTIMDKLHESFVTFMPPYTVDKTKARNAGEKRYNLCIKFRNTFIKNHKNLKLPEKLTAKDINNMGNSNNEHLLSQFFMGGFSYLERKLRIKLLDEVIYGENFKVKVEESLQKMFDEAYKAVIIYDEEFKTNDVKYHSNYEDSYGTGILNCLTENLNQELEFSNDIQN